MARACDLPTRPEVEDAVRCCAMLLESEKRSASPVTYNRPDGVLLLDDGVRKQGMGIEGRGFRNQPRQL